ncbi:MAG: UDP-N-acetylmuramate dehydrogenase [Bdellovibrionaceae bacterium]|nr:UDP-N-acetylmuramate dehydrogenase [Pseudobdellovibrionaceae bacterium]
MIIETNVPLAPYTSWLIGGPADFLCLPETEEQLSEALTIAKDKKFPVTILGGGTNVLVSDQGVRGLVICLKKFSRTEVELVTETKPEQSYLRIRALAGTPKAELLRIFLKYKMAPALFLAGLPGDVGGGVVMNAGVAESLVPREFGELVRSIQVLRWEKNTLQRIDLGRNQLRWTYRHSDGWQPGIITQVELVWPSIEVPSILEQVKAANLNRLQKQPLDKPSCGSVFVNPVGGKAAQIIDECGLKGLSIGSAQVSLKHANFIVNQGGATATDTWRLIQKVQQRVKELKGVNLTTEVVRLGEWGEA